MGAYEICDLMQYIGVRFRITICFQVVVRNEDVFSPFPLSLALENCCLHVPGSLLYFVWMLVKLLIYQLRSSKKIIVTYLRNIVSFRRENVFFLREIRKPICWQLQNLLVNFFCPENLSVWMLPFTIYRPSNYVLNAVHASNLIVTLSDFSTVFLQ